MFARLFRRGARRPAHVVEGKASRTGALLAWQGLGRPAWTPRDYASFAREGYMANPVVHRAVRMVAEAAASVTLTAWEGEREAPGHPLLALLARPNAREGGAAFLEAVYGHLLVSGNAYVERVDAGDRPAELHALRPDRMRVVPGPDGWAQAWDYTVDGRTLRFAAQEGAPAPILHLTLFHPLDDHYGLAPIEAAARALDVHNAAGAWNKALLDNAARPSGALVYAGPAGAPLGDEQFERLKAELEAGFQGTANAGRPLLLEGGLDWKPLSLSPRDMDFIEAKATAAREIALAFGVPPMLIGLPGDNTYANYAEANRSFWRQTVLPLVARTAQGLAHWLGPAWDGAALRLEPDLDRIDALAGERGELWARVGAATFLTDDEKRAAVGYGPRVGGAPGEAKENVITLTNPRWAEQPRVPAGSGDTSGQWTSWVGGLGDSFLLGLANITEASAAPVIRALLMRLVAQLRGLTPRSPSPPRPTPSPANPTGVGKATRDILLPSGERVGYQHRGASETVRTVSKTEFDAIESQLMNGARPLNKPDYSGKVYTRPDGMIFGIKISIRNNKSIDLFNPVATEIGITKINYR